MEDVETHERAASPPSQRAVRWMLVMKGEGTELDDRSANGDSGFGMTASAGTSAACASGNEEDTRSTSLLHSRESACRQLVRRMVPRWPLQRTRDSAARDATSQCNSLGRPAVSALCQAHDPTRLSLIARRALVWRVHRVAVCDLIARRAGGGLRASRCRFLLYLRGHSWRGGVRAMRCDADG